MRRFLWIVALAMGPAWCAGASVQELIDDAVRQGAREVALPRGVVRLEKSLLLRKIDGLTIRGQDTTLVFSDHRKTAISVVGCRNLVFRGFTIDYDPLPYVQGTITARSADGREIDFEVHPGYPGLRADDQADYRQAYVFEADRPRWLRRVPDLYPRKVEIRDERHGRLSFGRGPAMFEQIKPGHRIALTVRSANAIRMDDCENVRVEDLLILASPGPGVLCRYMRGENFFRYTIRPGPPPAGAGQPRLISTGADGFNYAFATRGPVLDGCRFSFMGDDSVNLHGATLLVLRQVGQRELLAAWPYAPEHLAGVMPPGGTVRLLGKGNWEVKGQARLEKFTAEKQRSEEDLAAIAAAWPRNPQGRGTVWRVTLDQPLPAQAGEFLDMPENNSPGFVIRNCVFEDHRARGLRIQASHGLIEDNIIRRTRMSAITLGAEYAFWREAGWVHDVVVHRNLLEDVCQDSQCWSVNDYALGAISVFGRREDKSKVSGWAGNRNLVIENNRVSGSATAGIFVAAARDVQIRSNRLERVMYHPGDQAGRQHDLDLHDPIDVRHAQNVQVEGNTVVEPGVAPGE